MKLFPVELSNLISAAENRALEWLLSETSIDLQQAVVTGLSGDGSERRFVRINDNSLSLVAVLPSLGSSEGKAEARSTWLIGRHLHKRGVPVPELYGVDQDTGIVLCEDLGDRLLHREVLNRQLTEKKITEIYSQAVSLLVQMQIEGGRGFDPEYCWDTSRYDRQLMLERESGYFFESCCCKMLGMGKLSIELEREFQKLAGFAAEAPADFFLHRDFQSRNLIIKDGRLRVLDFQGGRLGPLGYDLASLLIDPYVALKKDIRNKLFDKYLADLDAYNISTELITDSYQWLALQRNLQIIGAFASLGNEKGKPFFLKYLYPATVTLVELLDEPYGSRLPLLKAMAADLPGKIVAKLNSVNDV